MTPRNLLVVVSLALSVLLGLVLGRGEGAGPAAPSQARGGRVTIGLSLDTLKEARWQADRDLFVRRAGELGADVIVLAANGDDSVQIGDVEKLLTRGIDVLVIVPHDGTAMAKAVRLAHEAGVPVIAYDRIVRDADLDLYVSFDNLRVGELQARYLVEHLPTPGRGRIVRIYGAPSDNNAALFKQGQDRVLQPYIERGDIQVVHEDWAEDWKPENAKRILNAAITARGPRFDAVLASNDGTAAGEPFLDQGLHGAAELAVKVARREVVVATQTVENGAIAVPAALFEVVTVTRDNLMDTVIEDGFASYDEVYRGIPEAARPPRPAPASPSPTAAPAAATPVAPRMAPGA